MIGGLPRLLSATRNRSNFSLVYYVFDADIKYILYKQYIIIIWRSIPVELPYISKCTAE